MPGATVTRLAERTTPMRKKASMIPQTVPKRPMNGVTVPVVARKLIIRSIRAISWLAAFWRARFRVSIRAGVRAVLGFDFVK